MSASCSASQWFQAAGSDSACEGEGMYSTGKPACSTTAAAGLMVAKTGWR